MQKVGRKGWIQLGFRLATEPAAGWGAAAPLGFRLATEPHRGYHRAILGWVSLGLGRRGGRRGWGRAG